MSTSLRQALRSILASPRHSALRIVALAVGVAANMAVITLGYYLLWQPPAHVKEPSTLFISNDGVAFADLRQLVDSPGPFEVAAYLERTVNVRLDASSKSVSLGAVSPSYFDLLGVQPRAGRFLGPTDASDARLTCVVSESIVDILGPGASTPGASLFINGVPADIVGVAPRAFKGTGGQKLQLWIVVDDSPGVLRSGSDLTLLTDPSVRTLTLVLRSTDGRSLRAAEEWAQLNVAPNDRADGRDAQFRLHRPGGIGGNSAAAGAFVIVLQGAVLLIVAIATLNAGSLSLTDALRRRREFAIMVALGCSRSKIIRLRLLESAVIGLLVWPLGTLAGSLLLRIFSTWIAPGEFGTVLGDASALEPVVVLVGGVLSVGVSAAAAIIPAVRASRAQVGHLLQGVSSHLISTLPRALGNGLIAGQSALVVLLLVASSLLGQTADAIRTIPTGMNTERVYFSSIEPHVLGFDDARSRRVFSEIRIRLESEPGFDGVTLARSAPLQTNGWATGLSVSGSEHNTALGMVSYNAVADNYFEFFGLALLSGRSFSNGSDLARSTAVVNETLARHLNPHGSAIGTRVRVGSETGDRTVIGVVKDAKYTRLTSEPFQYLYIPLEDEPLQYGAVIHARTRGSAEAFGQALRRAASLVDVNVAVDGVDSLETQVARQILPHVVLSKFVGVTSLLSTALLCLGLYSTLANSVESRRRESALRAALGASNWHIWQMVSTQLLSRLAIGAAIGLGIGYTASALLEANLHGAPGINVSLVLKVLGTLVVTAVLSIIPLRSVFGRSHMAALREE